MNYKNALASFSTNFNVLFDSWDIELYNFLWIRYNTKMTTTITFPSTSTTTKPVSVKDAAQPNRTGSTNSLFSDENGDEHHPVTSSSIITTIASASAPSTSISIKDSAQLNRSGFSNSHFSDENSKEHHPIPPTSIESATITTTPISNPTKLSYSAKKRLARKKKKQAQLASSTVSNTTLRTPANTSIPKLSNTTPTKIYTTPTSVTPNTTPTSVTPNIRQALNTRQARRSPPYLRNFNVDAFSLQRLSYFRLDNSRSPTWSIQGDFFCGGENDRTIINVPSKLLHLVTYDNNSPPGCTFREKDDDNDDNDDDNSDDNDDDNDNDDDSDPYIYDDIIRINFHYSDSDSLILSNSSSCYDDTSDDDSCYDDDSCCDDNSDDDNNADSNNIYENKNINNKSCTY